jgi:adenine-specific DNA-methyltransferase
MSWYPNLLERSDEMNARYRNPDNDPRGVWKPADATAQGGHGTKNQFYELTAPNGKKHALPNGRCWVYTEAVFQQMIAENRIWFGPDGNNVPAVKRFLTEVKQGTACKTIWKYGDVGHNQEAKQEVNDLFPESAVFETPKPVRLIERMLQISSSVQSNDIILDFFAGSGTTAQAVLELNKEDGGNRKFLLVQLPEPTGREDYKTIADITKERVRRVIQKISRGEEEGLTRRREDAKGEKQLELDAELLIPDLSAQKPDSKPLRGFAPSREPGFKVFKLDTSNFKTWDGVRPESPEAVVQQLELHVDHVLAGRTQEDILTELLLKSGFPLCTQVERMEFSRESAKDAKFYYSVEEGTMLICLEKDLTAQMVKELAEKKPSRVICLDAGFQGSDQLKTNAVQTMKARGVLKFQTV